MQHYVVYFIYYKVTLHVPGIVLIHQQKYIKL